MKWTKFRLKTTTEAEDIVICALADAGVEGAQIEDNIPLTESDLQQMFVDIPLTGRLISASIWMKMRMWMRFLRESRKN